MLCTAWKKAIGPAKKFYYNYYSMIKNIKIGNKLIGENQPVFIIAEAGVNHNGNLKTALKLVDAASAAGADAIKFQTFRAEEVVTDRGKMAEYQINNIGREESQVEMLRGLELPDNFYGPIIKRCQEKKIIFLSTPHGGFKAVRLLERLKAPAFKFGSGDLTNLPVLEYAAKFGKPLILGTGMATLAEVKEAVKTIKKTGNGQIILLHCTTDYPCRFKDVNLLAMRTMMKELPALVGYSDHTFGIQVPIMAAAFGACLIEKHFTLDRKMPGPDHKASVEPAELKELVKAVHLVKEIFGSSVKSPALSERPTIKIARKSLVAAENIKKGEIFSEKNLAIKRPGGGLEPKVWYRLIGRPAKADFLKDELIRI